MILSTITFAFCNMSEHFPALTGQVIDNANLLHVNTKQKLTNMLKNEEKTSSNQIVILTIKSLHGYAIEEFSIDLARYWGIGQKDKNNGVLLLISKNDRKMRIEVGYGLEGSLTDKISHEIITYTLTPAFKKGDYDSGVLRATNEILQAIKGEYSAKNNISNKDEMPIFATFLVGFFILMFGGISKRKILKRIGFSAFISAFTFPVLYQIFNASLMVSIAVLIIVFIVIFLLAKKIDFSKSNRDYSSIGYGGSGGGFGGSGSFGGGFSGGGGGFGGGGASGGW